MTRKQKRKQRERKRANLPEAQVVRSRRLRISVGAVLFLVVLTLVQGITALGQAGETALNTKELTPTVEELELKQRLDSVTEEIATIRESLRALRDRRGSLEDEITEIEAEVRRTELSITRSEIAITALTYEISKVEERIAVYTEAVATRQTTIAEIVRRVAERDEVPLLVVFFSTKSIGDVANEIQEAVNIQQKLVLSIGELRAAQGVLALEQERLDDQRRTEEEARSLIVVAREELFIKQELQRQLLEKTETESVETKEVLSLTQLDAARIRRQLFPLTDVGEGLTFQEAYLIADPIASTVGIRTAFLLAILQKETHLGELKGTGTWRIDMHPRDWEAFFRITSELGLDPDVVPVSRKPSYGWGGAMGPAQFLPSTWLGYKTTVAEVTGNDPPSPWNIEDAFAASAVKLARDGAWAQNEDAEWKAAMIYFAGGNWSNPAFAFYGDTVEDLTARFLAMIAILEEDLAKLDARKDGAE